MRVFACAGLPADTREIWITSFRFVINPIEFLLEKPRLPPEVEPSIRLEAIDRQSNSSGSSGVTSRITFWCPQSLTLSLLLNLYACSGRHQDVGRAILAKRAETSLVKPETPPRTESLNHVCHLDPPVSKTARCERRPKRELSVSVAICEAMSAPSARGEVDTDALLAVRACCRLLGPPCPNRGHRPPDYLYRHWSRHHEAAFTPANLPSPVMTAEHPVPLFVAIDVPATDQ